jgi:uncharacterized YigZ family protein
MKTIFNNNINEIVIEKSKFITYISQVNSPSDAMNQIEKIRKEHPQATHHCFAYRIDENNLRQSDDGEPSGTAGKPILKIIEHNDLIYTLIVVVRYYGGTKLGTGGLIRAYQSSAKKIVETSNIGSYIKYKIFSFQVKYINQIKIEQILRKKSILVLNQVYMPNYVTLTIQIEEISIDEFKQIYSHLFEEENV